ncbi:small ribosomal subunit protein cS22-like [Phragmites australis]|uniref:small ribosomal subunit protein cS22-like n=1 Tax=Phragmites australis TaxID=29695 RepID=UPI002D7865CD|nr:small ribosomal subunit protein cS22-like [Phragmites australis]
MATTISSLITPPALHRRCQSLASASTPASLSFRAVAAPRASRWAVALRVAASSAVLEAPEEVAARKLYVGNIPRTVTNDELRDMFAEHGTVERAEVMYDKYTNRSRRFGFVTMSTAEEANAAVESLNGTEVGGRTIKVNVTESFLPNIDRSAPEPEPVFVDSQYKVYVGNLAKTVTTEVLKNFFSEKGHILSATVSRIPGTSKSKGYGFVTFSSEEEVEAAVATFNNAQLEGQPIRVNRA